MDIFKNKLRAETYLSPFLSCGVSGKPFYNIFPNEGAKINISQSEISLLDDLYLFQ